MRIGVAGIGKMGAAIAARLIEVGHEVAVWNRTPDKAKAVAGATSRRHAGGARASAPTPSSPSSPTPRRSMQSIKGHPACSAATSRGKLFIEMSTVLPATEVALAAAVRGKGAAFRRMPGRRLDRTGAARQAPRAHGSRRSRRRPRAADPGTAVPARSNMPARSGPARSSNSPSTCRSWSIGRRWAKRWRSRARCRSIRRG